MTQYADAVEQFTLAADTIRRLVQDYPDDMVSLEIFVKKNKNSAPLQKLCIAILKVGSDFRDLKGALG